MSGKHPQMVRLAYFCGKQYHALNIREFNINYHLDLYYQADEDLENRVLEMRRWCEEEMGRPFSFWIDDINSDIRWICNNGELWFRDPTDLFAFILRWQ